MERIYENRIGGRVADAISFCIQGCDNGKDCLYNWSRSGREKGQSRGKKVLRDNEGGKKVLAT